VATIVGGQIHVIGAGTTTITAAQPGNATYAAAQLVQRELTIGKTPQTITFAPFADEEVTAADFFADGTASSGLAVTYTSSNTAVAAIVNGNMIHPVGVGITIITASQAGDAAYAAATPIQRELKIIKAGQYITLDRFGKIPFGNPDVEPRITKSTDLPVTLTSSNPAVATIVNGKIHLVGAGTTTITATVAGDARYLPASSEPQTLVVDKARQTISFELIADKALGSPDFDLVASSTSGLPITFTPTPSRPAVATVTDGRVHIVGTGFLTIAANQPGNDNYLPATVFYRTLQVYTRQPQTIAFAPFADVNIDEADFFANGHALSELPVTYTSSNPAVATIVGDMIHIVGLGTATITASQAGNDHWLAAPNVSQNLTVIKANQYISFSSMGKRTFGQPDFVPPATASSGLPLTFTSSDLSVATIVDGKIHIVGSGSSTITASQAGNERYFAAANQTGLLAVTSALQTITFAELPPKTTTDADFDLTATASSGFAVTYTSSNTSVATVSGNTVHILRAGTTNIKASQVGGAGYQAAPDVTRVLTVGKTAQTINFAALTTAQLSDPDFDPKAAATSGLPVTYISSNPAVAIIIDGKIHYIGAGTTDITALQAGDATYSAAAPVIRSQTVTNIIGQTITFANFGKKALGDIDFNPNATSSAGLPVTLTSDNPAVATIVDGKIHLVGVGAANITASQPGNATTSPAEPVSRFLIVDKQFQSISFNNISNRKFNSPDITLVATSSVGLPVTFTTSNAIVAVILNGKLHIVGVGPVTITATQGGNETVAAAVPVLRTLTITKGTQTITFPALGNKNFSDADIDPNATASSTLPVGLESSNTAVATIVDGKIHLVGLGITTITASQVGDDHWEAALPVSYTITVSKGKQTITFPIVTDKLVSIPDFDPLATASSGLKIIYTSNNPSIATIVDGKVHAVRAGNVKITASQPGNELYRPAPNAVRSIHFSNLSIQTITFPAMAKKDYGIPDFNFVASTNSGLPLTIVSSNPAVAVVIDGKVHIVGAGFTTFTVSQPGNDAIAAATPVSRQFTVQKADQTITFTAIPEKLVTDADFEIKAASSSGLPVTFTNENPLVFTLTGNMVHILLAASGKVTATQLGNANYNAARGVSQFIVIRPIAQTIAFEPLPAKLVNDADVILTATASSGLAVTYASSNPAVATIVDGKLHIIGAGTTQITASQAGNTTIGFAADVTRAFVVNKVPQTITFDADRISVGIPFTLTATASSGLPVTYTVTDDTYATIVGSVLTGLRRGAVSVTAIQAGNETYAAATPVSKTINITQDLAIRPNNVLSPNGDGHNDVWVITNIEDYPANNVRVYNRANHLVFEANNYHNDWGGTERGGILTQDAYLYVINLGNGSPVITGYITLVR
jgi:gliding motility-associated-like protein